MAEVIEINLICEDVLSYEILFSFIHKQAEIDYSSRVIEVMDNWEYENSYVVNSKEDLNNMINTKIVCITEKANEGYVGLNIEKVEDKFCYTIWFNLEKYESVSDYYQLIKAFITFVKQRIVNKFTLCAIGKEVVFEFQGNYNTLLNNSHNIDIWIYVDALFDFEKDTYDSNLINYELIKLDDYEMLRKKHIDIDLSN